MLFPFSAHARYTERSTGFLMLSAKRAVILEPVRHGDRGEDHHHQGRRAAHPASDRHRAGKGDVDAAQRSREVPRESPGHRHRVVRPLSDGRQQGRIQLELDGAELARIFLETDPLPAPRRSRKQESPVDGAHDRSSACIVGMAAEHLDPSGNKPQADLLAGSRTGPALEGFEELKRLLTARFPVLGQEIGSVEPDF